jgi:hypothetical protein
MAGGTAGAVQRPRWLLPCVHCGQVGVTTRVRECRACQSCSHRRPAACHAAGGTHATQLLHAWLAWRSAPARSCPSREHAPPLRPPQADGVFCSLTATEGVRLSKSAPAASTPAHTQHTAPAALSAPTQGTGCSRLLAGMPVDAPAVLAATRVMSTASPADGCEGCSAGGVVKCCVLCAWCCDAARHSAWAATHSTHLRARAAPPPRRQLLRRPGRRQPRPPPRPQARQQRRPRCLGVRRVRASRRGVGGAVRTAPRMRQCVCALPCQAGACVRRCLADNAHARTRPSCVHAARSGAPQLTKRSAPACTRDRALAHVAVLVLGSGGWVNSGDTVLWWALCVRHRECPQHGGENGGARDQRSKPAGVRDVLKALHARVAVGCGLLVRTTRLQATTAGV